MSQENVEIVRRAYSLLGDLPGARRGDHDDVFLDYFSDRAELVPPPIYPDVEPVYVRCGTLGLCGLKSSLTVAKPSRPPGYRGSETSIACERFSRGNERRC
jgi:hypothetical protein